MAILSEKDFIRDIERGLYTLGTYEEPDMDISFNTKKENKKEGDDNE